MDTLFTFDWEKVYPKVIQGLVDGSVTLRDGVAYWSTQADKAGILQHMPLKQVSIDPADLSELPSAIKKLVQTTQSAQAASLTAVGISTGIIVGAIVLQTIYLSHKIDSLQAKVDLISQDVHSQNVIYFMGKMSEYFGVVESARVLLLDKSLVEETRDQASTLITQLSIKRNELMSLIRNLITFADQVSERHLSHMLDFITMMLDLMPKAIYIEAQLCDRHGKFRLAEHLLRESGQHYHQVLNQYKNWCNNRIKNIISGHSDPKAICFHNKKDELKTLFSAEDNRLLLQPLQTPQLEKAQRSDLNITTAQTLRTV